MNPEDKIQELIIREKLFLEMEDGDLDIRLTKLEQLLEELKKADQDKEAV